MPVVMWENAQEWNHNTVSIVWPWINLHNKSEKKQADVFAKKKKSQE